MEQNKRKKINGVNIRLLNSFFIVVTALVFAFILLISYNVNARFNAVKEAINKFIICEQSSKSIKESSNNLTELARMFVVSHDLKYAHAYLRETEETKTQQKAVHDLEQVCSTKDLALQRLKIALTQSESLSSLELYAMRLACESDPSITPPPGIKDIILSSTDKLLSRDQMRLTAINNLFGEGYLIYKTRVNENCTLTVSSIEQQITEELNLNANQLGESLLKLRLLFFVLLLINMLLFIAFAILIFHPLKEFETSIRRDEQLKLIGSVEFKNLASSYNENYELKERNQKDLLKKAEYDALTGILNRRAFDQICKTSAEHSRRIALVLIDMDNFKHINDTYGHEGGDTALRELARLLMETFRQDDYVARIGGDEFAAILPDFKPERKDLIIEKINHLNTALEHIKDDIKPVSVSVGIAFSEVGFNTEVYKNADRALYIVKEKGKKGCEVYSPEENRA